MFCFCLLAGRQEEEKRSGDIAFAAGKLEGGCSFIPLPMLAHSFSLCLSDGRKHYSLALSLDPSYVAAFSNRAAASLGTTRLCCCGRHTLHYFSSPALGDHKAVVVDCCCAMAVMDDRFSLLLLNVSALIYIHLFFTLTRGENAFLEAPDNVKSDDANSAALGKHLKPQG